MAFTYNDSVPAAGAKLGLSLWIRTSTVVGCAVTELTTAEKDYNDWYGTSATLDPANSTPSNFIHIGVNEDGHGFTEKSGSKQKLADTTQITKNITTDFKAICFGVTMDNYEALYDNFHNVRCDIIEWECKSNPELNDEFYVCYGMRLNIAKKAVQGELLEIEITGQIDNRYQIDDLNDTPP